MKKIINNKLYDTDRAGLIYEFCEKVKGDECWFRKEYSFCYWTDVQIYRTLNGNYFLHYNASSGYDEFIKVATEDDVKRIIKSLNPDKYIELFGLDGIEVA